MRGEVQTNGLLFLLNDDCLGGVSDEVKGESVLGNLQKVNSSVYPDEGHKAVDLHS